MKKAILATKVGMTQIFSEDGVLTPVTVLQAGPCVVTQVKTVENDGYSAVPVSYTHLDVYKRQVWYTPPHKSVQSEADIARISSFDDCLQGDKIVFGEGLEIL